MPANETHACKILIAEDQSDLREMIASTLRMAGHEVAAEPDGEAALRTAQQIHPDLIIMDVHMPLLSGFEVCAQLKADKAFLDVRILLISGMANNQEIQAGLNAGAQEYIRKPFELGHFQRVDALLTED